MGTRDEFINAMLSFEGAKDGNAKHHYIVDTYNKFVSAGLSKGSKYIMKYSDPWCATTVSAAAIIAGCTDAVPTECSCTRQINLFRAIGCYDENDDRRPNVGEVCYYNWQERTSPADVANHVGIVVNVDLSANKFTVAEGNYNGMWKTRVIPFGWKYIHGFAVPKFADGSSIVYTVQKGDNLSKIASMMRMQYGLNLSYVDIANKNNIKPPYVIYPGQKLIIK